MPARQFWRGEVLAVRARSKRYSFCAESAMRLVMFPCAVLIGLAAAPSCGGLVNRSTGDSDAGGDGVATDAAPGADGGHVSSLDGSQGWPDGQCFPDLAGCTEGTQCCAGTCTGGQCAAGSRTCLPDGLGCQHPAQCCSQTCADVCGAVPAEASLADVAVGDAGGTICTVGSTTCDACLSSACCAQVEACKNDAVCTKALQCLTSCEQNGGSGFACAQGQCSAPADQFTTNLFTCGSQKCLSPCYSD